MRAPRNLLIAPDLSRDPRFILAECAMPTPRMFEPAHVFRGPRIGYGPSRGGLKTGADNRWAKKASTTRRVFRPTEMGCSPRPITPSLRAPIGHVPFRNPFDWLGSENTRSKTAHFII